MVKGAPIPSGAFTHRFKGRDMQTSGISTHQTVETVATTSMRRASESKSPREILDTPPWPLPASRWSSEISRAFHTILGFKEV